MKKYGLGSRAFVAGVLAAGLLLVPLLSHGESVPRFSEIKDVIEKKVSFFSHMAPIIASANKVVRQEREMLHIVLPAFQRGVTSHSQRGIVSVLAVKYEVPFSDYPSLFTVESLLRRVDEVPVSLALAQAAIETGWGSSRFAQQHKNYFGLWCFTPGCGVVPKQRNPILSHEVANFPSIADGTAAYLHVLNTRNLLKPFRSARAELRHKQHPLDGEILAPGLINYSAGANTYVNKVKTIIRRNQLKRHDQPAPTS